MAVLDNALTTLQKIKDFLGITNTDNDTLLERLIDSGTATIENITRRKLKYDETGSLTEGVYTPATTPRHCLLDGTGIIDIWLPEYPIQSISLVRARDTTSSSWVTISSDDYVIDYNTGRIALASAVLPVTGVWPKGRQTCEFTYKAGYDYANGELPASIELALWQLVHYYYASRKRDPGMKTETLVGVYNYSRDALDPEWGIPRDIVNKVLYFRKVLV